LPNSKPPHSSECGWQGGCIGTYSEVNRFYFLR
jgi:hypothetical protein